MHAQLQCCVRDIFRQVHVRLQQTGIELHIYQCQSSKKAKQNLFPTETPVALHQIISPLREVLLRTETI